MARIFYGVCGEGRGHATRVQAVVEELRGSNEIAIYAPAQAYDHLAPAYRGSGITVRRIPGLGFHYSDGFKLDYWRTAWRALCDLGRFSEVIREVQRNIDRDQPDLVITDFEPILPRAARRCGAPFLSLNHQHFLLTYDLRVLHPSLRFQAALMAQVVRAYYTGQVHTIVSSFYFPPLKTHCHNVTQIGVLLRRQVLAAQREEGPHLVVYFRRFASAEVWNALGQCGCEVRAYGLGARPRSGSVRFFTADPERFLADLATSRGLISTAGNQLIGEALFLGKPVLAIPEPGNYEQAINAHFLRETGAGMSVDMDRFTPAMVHRFLEHADDFHYSMDRSRLCGNSVALGVINRILKGSPSPLAKPRPSSLHGRLRFETISDISI